MSNTISILPKIIGHGPNLEKASRTTTTKKTNLVIFYKIKSNQAIFCNILKCQHHEKSRNAKEPLQLKRRLKRHEN